MRHKVDFAKIDFFHQNWEGFSKSTHPTRVLTIVQTSLFSKTTSFFSKQRLPSWMGRVRIGVRKRLQLLIVTLSFGFEPNKTFLTEYKCFVLYLFIVLTMILGHNVTIGKRAELLYDLLFPPCLSIKSYMERAREEEREKEWVKEKK